MAAPTAPLTCFPLSSTVTELFSAWDEQLLKQAHAAASREDNIKKHNALICGTVDSLLIHARDTGFVARFKEMCGKEKDPYKLELELFSYRRTIINGNPYHVLPSGQTVVAYAHSFGSYDQRVGDLPSIASMPWTVTTDDFEIPLREIFGGKYDTLDLLSIYLGENFRVYQKLDDVEYLDDEQYIGVTTSRIMVKFYPKGLTKWHRDVLAVCKKRRGIKARAEQIAEEAVYYLPECECGCGNVDRTGERAGYA